MENLSYGMLISKIRRIMEISPGSRRDTEEAILDTILYYLGEYTVNDGIITKGENSFEEYKVK